MFLGFGVQGLALSGFRVLGVRGFRVSGCKEPSPTNPPWLIKGVDFPVTYLSILWLGTHESPEP